MKVLSPLLFIVPLDSLFLVWWSFGTVLSAPALRIIRHMDGTIISVLEAVRTADDW